MKDARDKAFFMSETAKINTIDGVLTLQQPSTRAQRPIVFDSPHSGRIYPSDFNTAIDHEILQKSEDRFVDELFAHVVDEGASFLKAEFPRLYIDPNRCDKDIHPSQIAKACASLPTHPSAKATAGIGLIHQKTNAGQDIYERALELDEIKHRITHYHKPYHDALKQELSRLRSNFPRVLHINCHSMPKNAAPKTAQDSVFPNTQTKTKRADIVLGTLDGKSISEEWVSLIYDTLKELGFSVILNKPFKGAEIVKRYGHPDQDIHSIQLEINRQLYLCEEGLERSENFDALIEKLKSFTTVITQKFK